jgi:hypothetical protein
MNGTCSQRTWIDKEIYRHQHNITSLTIVTFYPPLNSRPLNVHAPFVRIAVDNKAAKSLSNYLQDLTNSLSQTQANYTTINSNTTAKLGGFPAYSLEFSYRNTGDNSTYRELRLGTMISGSALYGILCCFIRIFSISSNSFEDD